jgi:hypothetical protein
MEKRRGNKKKKKKRRLVGGGEETIANITIDDRSMDEDGIANNIDLNPMVKKKVKKAKKKPKTKLNTVVEEDSKELSNTLRDAPKFDSLISSQKSISESEGKEDNIPYKDIPSGEENNICTHSKPTKKYSSFKPSDLVIEKESVEQPVDNNLSKDENNRETRKEIWDQEDKYDDDFEPPILQPSTTSKIISNIYVEEPKPESKNRIMYLKTQEEKLAPEEIMKPSCVLPVVSSQVSPDKTEMHDKSTEDQSIVHPKFSTKIFDERLDPPKKLKTISEKILIKKLPSPLNRNELEGFGGAISLLPLNCEIHRDENIKYFCREDDWKFGICEECLSQHVEHDYIYADEIASFEIKQALKATMTECSYKSKLQKMLYSETLKMSKYLEEMKSQEFAKIQHYFEELHKELDKKEKQMKAMYEEQVGDVERVLEKDINILKNRLDEFSIIERKLREKAERFRMSNDLAIVANAYEVFDLQRKIKI